MIPFEVTILGTSSALPTILRYPTAHIVNLCERFFLIDCGEGTQIQMRKYSVKFSRLNHILISHLHGDHYFGLIGLLSTFSLLGRKADLHIYSHSDLPEILKPQLEYIQTDVSFRIVWHPLNFKKTDTIIDNEIVTVTSFPLKHRIPCCGFLFTEKPRERNIIREKIEQYKIPLREIHLIKKGADFSDSNGNIIPNSELTTLKTKPRKYAFCTDTLYLPEIKDIISGCDLLYHEATYDKKLTKQATETYHTTSEQAAQLAYDSNVNKLLIGHFSARYKNVTTLLDEARSIFPNTIAAEEGMKISL
jgi:ribonuclease Z